MKREYLVIGIVLILVFGVFLFDKFSVSEVTLEKKTVSGDFETAYFAGGCFWCVESDFEKLLGVIEVTSGYSGGLVENPTYKQVSSGVTGHRESVKVIYDPLKITYSELLEDFWKHMDPTDLEGQFVDRGEQYTSAIFYVDETQKQIAEESKEKLKLLEIFDRPIVTEIIPLQNFYEAEEYHQDYYLKSSFAYGFYRFNSGRDQFLEKIWTNENINKLSEVFGTYEVKYMRPSDEEIKNKLTDIQYYVTQEDGTEKPFDNEYDKNYEEGIYVDVVTGEPLFSSIDKYDSGTGWPSFTKPLASENIIEKTDYKLIFPRTEIRSKIGDSHLGHLFKDGPKPTGDRYCMNSAALRFVPKEKLEEEGYGKYLSLFK